MWQITYKSSVKLLKTKHWLTLYLFFIKTLYLSQCNLKLDPSLFWTLISLENTRSIGWSVSKKNIKLTHELGSSNSLRYSSNNKPTVHTPLRLQKSNLLWNLFLQSWGIFRPKSNIIYQINRNFRLFFLTSAPTSTKLPLVSIQRYFSRWVDSYNFVFNLFLTQPFTQMISNKLFIEESLVFNWNYSFKNYKLFRYVQPFFIFADITHGAYVRKALSLIFLNKIDFTLTTDINNHNKLSTYLQKNNIFTVALVPNNYSPWRVSYPIPAFSDSPLTQLYFIKWILSLQRQARSSTFLIKKKLWSATIFNSLWIN